MRSCRWAQGAVLAALLITLASTARADALADARKAVETSDYLRAQPALETALTAGTAGPDDLAEIYRLTGIVQGALGNEDAAEEAFGKWLALAPRGSLPPGTSPKITRPFDVAQALIKKQGALEAKAETADDPPAVTLVVVNDPMKMIVGAKVYYVTDRKPEEALEAEGTSRVTIELGTRPLYLKWWVWGSAAVVATGVGGYFGWRTHVDLDRLDYLNANSLAHTWQEAQDVEASARRNLLVTNIAAGAAGAFALGTAILFLTRPTSTETELRVTLTPSASGGAVVLGGQF